MDTANQQRVLDLLNNLPDEYLPDVVRFVSALKNGSDEPIMTHLASESVLTKDWLKPEEDEAWASL